MERTDLDMEGVHARLQSLPIFPLPSSVLIPGGHLPLHVFEPRYRALVRDCLARDGLLGIALLSEPGDEHEHLPAVHPVTGMGLISAHAELPDGRFYILVEGLLRARILKELDSGEPYRVVVAAPMPDEDPLDSDRLSLSGRILRRLVLDLSRRLPGKTGGPLAQACVGQSDPGRLADIVAAAILVDHRQRQRFLEESDPERRLDLMTAAVSSVLTRMAQPSSPN